jgi:hypothetical protein
VFAGREGEVCRGLLRRWAKHRIEGLGSRVLQALPRVVFSLKRW